MLGIIGQLIREAVGGFTPDKRPLDFAQTKPGTTACGAYDVHDRAESLRIGEAVGDAIRADIANLKFDPEIVARNRARCMAENARDASTDEDV